YSDGGSIFVEFKDASGVARSACLLNEMDGDKNLTVDDKVLSINGAEERAFLELLERWLRQDSVAQRYLDGEPLSADETPHINDAGRWFAVSILESLRARKNGGRHDK
ncbi:MAG: hypothetical protein JSS02_08120, partial [Planctomycetes bacterium]|nr:hypothetical protein [Planctomycetota bacterium]